MSGVQESGLYIQTPRICAVAITQGKFSYVKGLDERGLSYYGKNAHSY